jgi:hypothetical protein
MKLNGRLPYLAIAVFTFSVQAAAAAHLPALHEEPVSACKDVGEHFCAETVEHHTGPCVLCQVSLNGVYFQPVATMQAVLQAEPVVAVAPEPVDFSTFLRSHGPRAPPVVG